MIFNLFSNIGPFSGELEFLQSIYWKKKIQTPGIYSNEPILVDPVVKLLEEIKQRDIEILIPTKREIIPSIWNNSPQNTVTIQIEPQKTNGKMMLPTKSFSNKRYTNFPTAQQKLILKKLNTIPVYTVVSKENELIMAIPRDIEYGNIFNWLYKKYYEYFVWKNDDGQISMALFFMNKEDAALYMQSLGKSDTKIVEKNKIRIKKTSLAHFYYLSRTLPMGQQARLIADLLEIQKTVHSHIPSQLPRPHIKQSYTKNSFIGTPIYTVNIALNKDTYDKKNLEVMRTQIDKYLNRVFFTLQDAYLAWEKICETNKTAKLSIRPSVEIYNLENYLEDLEKSPLKILKKIEFTPSFNSIKTLQEIKLNPPNKVEDTANNNIWKPIKRYFKTEKLADFYKGVVWMFTSDTLPTKENAW